MVMKKGAIILLVLICNAAFGQHKVNVVLKKQLDSVMILDQKYRDTLSLLMDPQKADSVSKALSFKAGQAMNHYWALQNRLDSLNVVFIEAVFKKYGYPGKTLVDTPANEAAWYIIQHSKKIAWYLPMMKKAAEDKELPFQLYAKMLDRELMYEGKEQIYGTQGVCRPLKNGKNIGCYIWPIKDAETVNKRRKEAGFDQTVEQNAARMDIAYSVIKLDQVK
jgi:hypothetical protein